MATATLSSKGQLVLPKEIRTRAGLRAGDVIDVAIEDETGDVFLRKAKSIDELSDYFTGLIQQGTQPLENASTLYETREARA